MHILGVGLSKTGTSSLFHALGILGLHAIHYDTKRLNDVLDGSNSHPNFRRYDDLDAVLDLPSAYFYDELLCAYPDCKCILTLRDEEEWWHSIENHFNKRTPLRHASDDPINWIIRHYVYGSAHAFEYLYRKKFREHNMRVIARVPSSQLLIMNIIDGDGWDKLCPFIDVDVPNMPFPHQNAQISHTNNYSDETLYEITRNINVKEPFILIDDGLLQPQILSSLHAVPFMQNGSGFSEHPNDDASAISKLEQHKNMGIEYVVFLWTSFWWFHHYYYFFQHMRKHYKQIYNSDRVIIYNLKQCP